MPNKHNNQKVPYTHICCECDGDLDLWRIHNETE